MPKSALGPRLHAAAQRCSQRVVRARLSSRYGRSDFDGRALVERHDDVRAERLLDLDRALRGEEPPAPVEVRLEAGALLGDLPALGEAVDLEAARVGEERAVPGHEPVQAAERPDQLVSGPQHQVVGVAEEDLRPERAEVVLADGLHRGLGAHGHEDRGLHRAVRRVQPPAPRVGSRIAMKPLVPEAHRTAPAAMKVASP